MIRLVPDAAVRPLEWFVAFKRQSKYWWAGGPFGTYKHVMCFGFVPAVNGWLVYDLGVNGLALAVVPDERSNKLIGDATDGALVLRWVPPLASTSRLKVLFTCAASVAHVIGLPSSALRPDGLLRDCLRAGAEIVIDDELGKQPTSSGPATGSREGCGG